MAQILYLLLQYDPYENEQSRRKVKYNAVNIGEKSREDSICFNVRRQPEITVMTPLPARRASSAISRGKPLKYNREPIAWRHQTSGALGI